MEKIFDSTVYVLMLFLKSCAFLSTSSHDFVDVIAFLYFYWICDIVVLNIETSCTNFLYKRLWHQSNLKADRLHIKYVSPPVHWRGEGCHVNL